MINFDLGFKLAIIDAILDNSGMKYAEEVYSKSFYAINVVISHDALLQELFYFKSMIQSVKNNIEVGNGCCLCENDRLFFQNKGLNDVHFEAINKALGLKYAETYSTHYSYSFFEKKGVDIETLDYVAYLICKYSKNPHLIVFGPAFIVFQMKVRLKWRAWFYPIMIAFIKRN